MVTYVIYFHGLGGSLDSVKGKQLKASLEKKFDDVEVIIPSLTLNLEADAAWLKSFISEHLNTMSKLVFTGISFGGLYARYFGEKYDVPYVIANPVVYLEDVERILPDTFENFDAVDGLRNVPCSGYLAHVMNTADDNVIPSYQKFFQYAADYRLLSRGGHNFDNNWYEFIEFVSEVILKP
jgi:hypothetical protein